MKDIMGITNVHLDSVVRGYTAAEQAHEGSEGSPNYKTHTGFERAALHDTLNCLLFLGDYPGWTADLGNMDGGVQLDAASHQVFGHFCKFLWSESDILCATIAIFCHI